MTPQEAKEHVLRHVSYKPNYHFTVHASERGIALDLSVPTEIDASGKARDIAYNVTYSEFFTVDYLQDHSTTWLNELVRNFIHRWERHESDEWLKVDGVCLFDPHSVSVSYVNGRAV